MKAIVKFNIDVVNIQTNYKGTLLVEYPSFQLKRELTFEVQRPAEIDARIVIYKDGRSAIDITGPFTKDKWDTLTPEQQLDMELFLDYFFEGITNMQSANPAEMIELEHILKLYSVSFRDGTTGAQWFHMPDREGNGQIIN